MAYHKISFLRCSGSSGTVCESSSAHKHVFCGFMYPLSWNHALSVNCVITKFESVVPLIVENIYSNAHTSFLIYWKQLSSYQKCSSAFYVALWYDVGRASLTTRQSRWSPRMVKLRGAKNWMNNKTRKSNSVKQKKCLKIQWEKQV
jgi:hypothetical protein